jgi:tetratricopeptide (TPR) repeat protein
MSHWCRRQTVELASSFIVAVTAVTLPAASPALAQSPPETKQEFVGGLLEFAAAAAGTYGDEGERLLSALMAMENGLIKWDAQVWVYETAIASKIDAAPPAVAADMRTVLGALFLERGRLDDAIRELEAAAVLDTRRADIRAFQALAYATANRPLEAAKAFEAASQLDPADPLKPYLVAQQFARANRAEEASTALARVSTVALPRAADPGTTRLAPFVQATLLEDAALGITVFVPPQYSQGFALVRQRKYEEAIVELRAAVGRDPLVSDRVNSSPRIAAGIAALRQAQFKMAIEHLRAGLELSPESSEAHRILGTAYWADQAYDASSEQLAQAVRLNPRDERSRMMLAEVLGESGQSAKAVATLQEAIAAMPDSGLAHYRLGRLYQSLQKESEALAEFEEALRLNPVTGVGGLFAHIGYLRLNAMNFDGAIETYKQAVSVDPNNAETHRKLGEAYRKQGRQDEALAEFVVALQIDPANADAHAALGQLYVAVGRPEEAVSVLQRAVTLNPAHREARYALGSTLVRLGRSDEGQKELQIFERLQAEALEKERRSYEVNLIRLEASLRNQEGKYAESAALWRKVVEQEPNQASNYFGLAMALSRAEQYESAVEAFQQLLKLDDRPDVHRHLSELYTKVGRPAEAASERARYDRLREESFRDRGNDR